MKSRTQEVWGDVRDPGRWWGGQGPTRKGEGAGPHLERAAFFSGLWAAQAEKPGRKARLGGWLGQGQGSPMLHPPKHPTSEAKVGVMRSADLTGAQETTTLDRKSVV